MAWIRITRGNGSVRNLKPIEGCGKAEVFLKDPRRRCTRWIRAMSRPDLWTPERIARDCKRCQYWQKEVKTNEGRKTSLLSKTFLPINLDFFPLS